MNYYCLSDIGLKREKNQDSYCGIKNHYNDYLFLVCDGIGGGRAGEVASGEVIKYFVEKFKDTPKLTSLNEAKDFIYKNINIVNRKIFALSNKVDKYRGMGTTVTGLFFTSFGVLSINCGDSRVYGFQDKKLFRLTADHTLVNDMIKKGEITYEEAVNHPKKHFLIRAVGVWNTVEPDIHKVKHLDYYLVCSDGLHGYVDSNKISLIMNDDNRNCENKCKALLNEALNAGGYDNISCIVIDANG